MSEGILIDFHSEIDQHVLHTIGRRRCKMNLYCIAGTDSELEGLYLHIRNREEVVFSFRQLNFTTPSVAITVTRLTIRLLDDTFVNTSQNHFNQSLTSLQKIYKVENYEISMTLSSKYLLTSGSVANVICKRLL